MTPRTRVALALLIALAVAVGTTAAVAYTVRPRRSTLTAESAANLQAPTVEADSPAAVPTVSPTATSTSAPSPTPTVRRMPRRTVTPQPTATSTPTSVPTRTPRPAPTATATIAPLYVAQGEELAAWTGQNWWNAAGVLTSDAEGIDQQPWLVAPYEVTAGAFAVEANIRVVGRAEGKCEQTFGVVAGLIDGPVWGGGVIFSCDGVARIRLTDVSDYTDGYNRDAELAVDEFDPGEDWHRYRLEIDGSNLRLLIDGQLVLEASIDESPGAMGQAGLWSQGAAVEVQEIVIFAL